MRTQPPRKPSIALTHVLDQSEHVKEIVEECAEELTSVNREIKREFSSPSKLPSITRALERSEAVESKVQDAAEKLAVVNDALEAEVRSRHELELSLAKATTREEASRHAALHDSLTGLPNRTLFDDRLRNALALASRHGGTLAVIFIDLDDFKEINDAHGHEAGDEVLRTIANRLRDGSREADTVSRHGGDEFLCLLTEMGDREAMDAIASKIGSAIRAPCRTGGRELTVEASLGIAVFPRDGDSVEALLDSADRAMYEAKRNGSGHAFAQ